MLPLLAMSRSSVFRKSAGRSSSPPLSLPRPGRLYRPGDLPQQKRAYGLGKLVSDVQGKVYTPAGLFAQGADWKRTAPVDPLDVLDSSDDSDDDEATGQPGNANSQYQKKERQWRRWSEQVIPTLVKPYLSLLRETNSLRDLEKVRSTRGCQGCSDGQMLEVSCVFFNSMPLFLYAYIIT